MQTDYLDGMSRSAAVQRHRPGGQRLHTTGESSRVLALTWYRIKKPPHGDGFNLLGRFNFTQRLHYLTALR